jgi:hypothetical protein
MDDPNVQQVRLTAKRFGLFQGQDFDTGKVPLLEIQSRESFIFDMTVSPSCANWIYRYPASILSSKAPNMRHLIM